jgi:hypothetical protein
VSALILAVVLTALTITESTSVFWARFSQIDLMHRTQSRALASSCAYESLLAYAEDSGSLLPGIITIQPGVTCAIEKIIPTPAGVSLYMEGTVSGTLVLLEVNASDNQSFQNSLNAQPLNTLALTSWKEVASIPPVIDTL